MVAGLWTPFVWPLLVVPPPSAIRPLTGAGFILFHPIDNVSQACALYVGHSFATYAFVSGYTDVLMPLPYVPAGDRLPVPHTSLYECEVSDPAPVATRSLRRWEALCRGTLTPDERALPPVVSAPPEQSELLPVQPSPVVTVGHEAPYQGL